MPGLRVVLDTAALWPNYLRCTLLRLANPAIDLYRPAWSPQILDELQRTLRERNAITQDGSTRLRRALDEGFPDALFNVPRDVIDAISLPDPDDRHVVGAAQVSRSPVIVTPNVSDFPSESLPSGAEVLTPDKFLLLLYRQTPEDVLDTMALQVAGYRRDPQTFAGLLERLRSSGASEFAYVVQEDNDLDDLEQRVLEYRQLEFEDGE